MGCAEGVVRILVFVANACLALVGFGVLVVGIIQKITYHKYTDAINDECQIVEDVPTIAISIGAIIFIIAFIGVCGIIRSNVWMLNSYGAILLILCVIQIALAIHTLATIQNDWALQSQLSYGIEDLFAKYNTDSSVKETVDTIQESLSCCGTTGRGSWGGHPPASCPTDQTAPPCEIALFDFVRSSIKTIGIIGITLSMIEIVGAAMAFSLACCIRGRKRREPYY